MTKPLPLSQVLNTLIDHVDATGKPVHIGWDDASQWEESALPYFVEAGLLVESNDAHSLECRGCEHRCFMPVELTDDKQRAFIVCDHMDMQREMGRINVPLSRLRQWQVSPKQFALVVSRLLGFDSAIKYKRETAIYELGMLKSNTGRRWVSLAINPLSIAINQHTIAINELLFIEDGALAIAHEGITELLNNPTQNQKEYTPNTDAREAKKLKTMAMYQDWKDAYIESAENNPDKNDSWHSRQVAKLPVARGRDPKTIRKNMKS